MYWQVESYVYYQMFNQGNVRAVIALKKSGGADGMYIYFMTGSPIPPPVLNLAVPIAYMAYETFANMIDMLREEKPIWADITSAGYGFVGTGNEPVGEAEGP